MPMMVEEVTLSANMETMVIMGVTMTMAQKILEMQEGPLVMRLISALVLEVAQVVETSWI